MVGFSFVVSNCCLGCFVGVFCGMCYLVVVLFCFGFLFDVCCWFAILMILLIDLVLLYDFG